MFAFQSSQRFFDKTGFHELPQAILNGVPIDKEEVSTGVKAQFSVPKVDTNSNTVTQTNIGEQSLAFFLKNARNRRRKQVEGLTVKQTTD